MIPKDDLMPISRWRETRERNSVEWLIELLDGDPSPLARTRLAEVLHHAGRLEDAEFLLRGIAPEQRLAVSWGVLGQVLIDRRKSLPRHEWADVYQRIVALPERLPADPTLIEGQTRLDFARGQAYGELGNAREAAILLRCALRGTQYLGLPERAVLAALERLEDRDDVRVERHRARLGELIAERHPTLIPVVADDLAVAAARSYNLLALRDALPHMHPSPEREALARALALLTGHRGLPAPETDLPNVGFTHTARYMLACERAVLAEMKLEGDRAERLAAEALRTRVPPLAGTLDESFTHLGDARMLLLTGDLAGALDRLSRVDRVNLQYATNMMRVEIDVRVSSALHRQVERHLALAHSALQAVSAEWRPALMHVWRRVTPNAHALLFHHHGQGSPLQLVGDWLRAASSKALVAHREQLDTDPAKLVAFEWLVAPYLPQGTRPE